MTNENLRVDPSGLTVVDQSPAIGIEGRRRAAKSSGCSVNSLGANIVDLLANSKHVSALAERERAARRGAPGWLGITKLEGTQADMFGDDATWVSAHPRSNAKRFGHVPAAAVMLGGIMVDGKSYTLEQFEELGLPAGKEIGITYFDPNTARGQRGKSLSTFWKLSRWPKTRTWETRPCVAAGKRVPPEERYKFMAEMLDYLPRTLALPRSGMGNERRTAWFGAYVLLAFLLFVRDNRKTVGVYGRQIDTARKLGLSVRCVNDLMQMLVWVGALRRLSYPTRERSSNLYEICWPDHAKSAAQPCPVPPPPTGGAS
jgi:hypothetical protein